MKLKTKIAQILRRWAEKLEPIFPYDVKHIPYLRGCFITTVKIVHQKNASAKGEDISKLFIC